MAHVHTHHAESSRPPDLRRLWLVLGLTASYAVAEVIGGILSGSLALLADAGHMVTDIVALALAMVAAWSARRPPDVARTYGYQRAEILAALFNGITLILIAAFICAEAWERFREPRPVAFGLMGLVAGGGLVVNIAGALLLHTEQRSLNLRGAYLHILGDLLGSIGALVAAVLIGLYGWFWADPLTSVIIAGIIVFSAVRLVLDAGNVLMEGVPGHLDAREVQDCLSSLAGVSSVHDLHLWTVGGREPVLSAHLVLDHTESAAVVLREATATLRDRFHITHSTLQLEPSDFNIVNGLTGAGTASRTGSASTDATGPGGQEPSRL